MNYSNTSTDLDEFEPITHLLNYLSGYGYRSPFKGDNLFFYPTGKEDVDGFGDDFEDRFGDGEGYGSGSGDGFEDVNSI
jgi:hypothetical protein